MTGLDKINEVCADILALTEEDIAAAKLDITAQLSYTHPFKMGKQKHLHELGIHNTVVIEKLLEMRAILINGNPNK